MIADVTTALTALEADLTTISGGLVGVALVVLVGRWIVARFF